MFGAWIEQRFDSVCFENAGSALSMRAGASPDEVRDLASISVRIY